MPAKLKYVRNEDAVFPVLVLLHVNLSQQTEAPGSRRIRGGRGLADSSSPGRCSRFAFIPSDDPTRSAALHVCKAADCLLCAWPVQWKPQTLAKVMSRPQPYRRHHDRDSSGRDNNSHRSRSSVQHTTVSAMYICDPCINSDDKIRKWFALKELINICNF